MKFVVNWLDDRTGMRRLLQEALFENIPGGARWRYVWGSTLTFAIMIQFITGIMLWMFYSPSANSAWESVYFIQHKIPGGDWLRGIHHWTAQFMILLLVLHLVQVIIDGAYKAPREFNFWFGLGLLGITMALGLTGYLLPWDQKGFWATEVATNIVANTPLVGDQLKQLMLGGSEAGHHTLTRFFALHAGVLPGMLILFIVVHIFLFRKHGITPAAPRTAGSQRCFWWVALILMLCVQGVLLLNWQALPDGKVANPMNENLTSKWLVQIITGFLTGICLLRVMYLQLRKAKLVEEDSKKPRRGDAYFWPDQVLRDAIACAAVLGAILFFVWQFGTELTAPADPSENYAAARPDWYFMALFQLLKDTNMIMGAFVIPGVVAGIVFLMPFLGRSKVGHGFNIVFLVLVLGFFVHFTMKAFNHDWTTESHQQAVAAAHVDADRIKELADAPDGIPPEGALALLRTDPLTQGPKLFAKNCASCHAYDGHDGLGAPRKEKQSASDLKGFASRDWVRGVLNAETFASANFFGSTKLIEKSKMHDFLKVDLTDLDENGTAEVESMVLALSAEAKLKSQVALDARDADKIADGFDLIGDEFASGCVDCHKFHDEGSKGPDLTGYGSRQWQIDFIRDPSHKRFYGKRNDRMATFGPKYDEEGKLLRPAQLTDDEIGFIVDWIRGDYYVEEPEEAKADH